jgi:Flp pilus assembly protein TadB
MNLFSILSSLLLILATVLLLGLTPQKITDDILKIVSPKKSLRDRIKIERGSKKSRKIPAELQKIQDALTATGKGGQFTAICSISLALFVGGGMFGAVIDNIFLVPILATALSCLPFIYAKSVISYYEKHIEDEIETALSTITSSYRRSDDLVNAVNENISSLKPPINDIFKAFIGDATVISPDIKHALQSLKGRIDNSIFKEWVDTLIQCQDDRTLKDALPSVIAKLSEVRLVNSELKTMLYEPRKEYFLMVAMVVGNVPLLYMLNKSWFATLMYTPPGKFVLALSGLTIMVTAILMMKFTKPIEYRR